jgi:hypothetical protein
LNAQDEIGKLSHLHAIWSAWWIKSLILHSIVPANLFFSSLGFENLVHGVCCNYESLVHDMVWSSLHLFVNFLWWKLSICSIYNLATQSVSLKLLFFQWHGEHTLFTLGISTATCCSSVDRRRASWSECCTSW